MGPPVISAGQGLSGELVPDAPDEVSSPDCRSSTDPSPPLSPSAVPPEVEVPPLRVLESAAPELPRDAPERLVPRLVPARLLLLAEASTTPFWMS